MLIDIGDDILGQEGLHMGSLFAVVLDRRGIESRFVAALVTDFTGLLDIVYRLVEEPGRDPNDFLEVFFVRAGSGELEAVESRFHTVFDYVRVGETPVGSQEHVWRFQVFFKPSDSGNQALGINKTLTDVEWSYLDYASITHLCCDAFEQLPIEVRRAVFAELQGTKCTPVIAALSEFNLDGTRRRRTL